MSSLLHFYFTVFFLFLTDAEQDSNGFFPVVVVVVEKKIATPRLLARVTFTGGQSEEKIRAQFSNRTATHANTQRESRTEKSARENLFVWKLANLIFRLELFLTSFKTTAERSDGDVSDFFTLI